MLQMSSTTPRPGHLWHTQPAFCQYLRHSIFFASLLVITVGCQLWQSPFVMTVNNAGAAFAAAATTLTFAHEGKVTRLYARSSFFNYNSALSGVDQQLASRQGTPDAKLARQLLTLYRPAMQAVKQPCLDASCDWRAQVAALDRASQSFLKAGNQ